MNQLTDLKQFSNFWRIKNFIIHNVELLVWISGLTLLYFMDMNSSNTLCIFSWFGVDSCPGCGVGHSIHYALHLNLTASYGAHWFGIPALLIILYRIIQLFSAFKNKLK